MKQVTDIEGYECKALQPEVILGRTGKTIPYIFLEWMALVRALVRVLVRALVRALVRVLVRAGSGTNLELSLHC